MKLGFFHDSVLTLHEGHYYSKTLSNSIWSRYLSIFDELVVSTRVINAAPNGLLPSDHPDVSFTPIDIYKAPASLISSLPQIILEIQKRLSEVDCALVRLPSVIGWVTYAVAASMKKPILVEMVGCPWDAYRNHSKKGALLAPFARSVTRSAVKRAPFTIYVTQQFLQERYPTRGMGVGISDVNISTQQDRLDRRLAKIRTLENSFAAINGPKGKITLGSIGTVDLPYKGYRTAVESVSSLIEQGYDVEYQIVGPGKQDDLQSFVDSLGIKEKVKLIGPLLGTDLDAWFDGIDVYIQPSLVEGLPRSVVEALAQGLPVILSEAGGHPELVHREFLFPPGNSKALTDRIVSLLKRDLSTIAKDNFETSTQYVNSKLQPKREQLLRDFRDYTLTSISNSTNGL